MPRTSIIMPNYNGMPYLKDAVASVLAQTDPDWELLFIDNGSTDDGWAWITSLAQRDARVKPCKHIEKQGPAHARNKALDLAQGRYIAFLDSDDLWHPHKLSVQLQAMAQGQSGMSCTWYDVIDETGNNIGSRQFVANHINRKRLLTGSEIGCLTVVLDRQIVGERRMQAIGHEDYALWLDILEDIPHAVCIHEILASYRVGQTSVSSNKIRAAGYQWNILRRHARLALPVAIWCFLRYSFNAVTRRFLSPGFALSVKK